jgi:hypothetical protein
MKACRYRRSASRWGSYDARSSILLATLCLTGCVFYPDSSESFDDEVVATHYDKDTDFGDFKTFAIDPVVHLATVNSDGSVDDEAVDKALGDPIIARIVSNMTSRGYQQVTKTGKPDLGISVTAFKGTVIGSSYWYPYYGYYWGYPSWGYYYPYEIYYSYNTGTLLIDTVDLLSARKHPQPVLRDGGVPDGGAIAGGLAVVWTGAAYKALNYEQATADAVRTAQKAVDQEFKQSPYLKRN